MRGMSPGSVAVIIPAFNERASIARVVRSVKRELGQLCRIYVVDDGSGDDTRAQARQAGACVLPLAINVGAWCAIQAGFLAAMRAGCEYFVTMDADGQHSPVMIPRLFEAMRATGAGLVMGSYPERASRLRKIAFRTFRTVTGLQFHDFTTGFKLYDRRTVAMLLDPVLTTYDYQDVGILLFLRRRHVDMVEVPVLMECRQDGKSRIFRSWFRVALYLLQSMLLSVADWFYEKGQTDNDWERYGSL
ncbi:MAG: glycosyltransferase family 2 protein [Desulfovibrionaceae bacterium]